MSMYKSIKKALTSTVDMVVDKTASQAQKNRLVTVMKAEEKTTNQLYIQLGQYLYSNLRDTLPEDVARLCGLIDDSKERMSRAQAKYREVIQQEIINREISKAEAKDNFEKIKQPIVTKAKDTAVKVKDTAIDTAAKVKADTAVKVDEIKRAAAEKANEIKRGQHNTVVDAGAGVTDISADTDEIRENIVEVTEEAYVEDAIAEAIDVSQDMAVEPKVTEESEISATLEPELPIITAEGSEAASEDDDPTPEDKPIDQEFQRSIPVDIISETEFEEDEPEVKPLDRTNPLAKAMKLRRIINKKNEE